MNEDKEKTVEDIFQKAVFTGLVQKNMNDTLKTVERLADKVLKVYDHIDRIDRDLFFFKMLSMTFFIAFCVLLLLVRRGM